MVLFSALAVIFLCNGYVNVETLDTLALSCHCNQTVVVRVSVAINANSKHSTSSTHMKSNTIHSIYLFDFLIFIYYCYCCFSSCCCFYPLFFKCDFIDREHLFSLHGFSRNFFFTWFNFVYIHHAPYPCRFDDPNIKLNFFLFSAFLTAFCQHRNNCLNVQ